MRPARLPPVPVVQVSSHEWKVYERWTATFEGVTWTIRQGFRFNFASVPRLFWRVVSPYELSDAATAIHDYGYHWQGNCPRGAVEPYRKFSRREMDELFFRLMEAKGIPAWRRWPAYFAVRLFGGPAWWSDDLTSEDLRDYAASWETCAAAGHGPTATKGEQP